MRTTVVIDDELLVTAKERARALGLALGQYVERALRRAAADEREHPAGPPIPVFGGKLGVQPGVALSSNRALHESLDEGQPIDKLR